MSFLNYEKTTVTQTRPYSFYEIINGKFVF